mgnify:FL=1
MDRPYIICHMLVSYDNKITGSFMFSPETSGLIGEYGRIDREFNAQAWLCGKTTMEEFTGGLQPDSTIKAKFSKEDYVAKKDVGQYVVVTDAMGEIGYAKPYLEKGGRKSYIIELLTYGASDEYVAYLRKMGISYIFAGEKELNLALAMQKLKSLFGIKLLVSHGGGYTNSTFLKAGLIDELSLVRVPLAEDNDKEVSLFGKEEVPQPLFELKSAEKLENGGEWLRYLIK